MRSYVTETVFSPGCVAIRVKVMAKTAQEAVTTARGAIQTVFMASAEGMGDTTVEEIRDGV